MYIIIYSILFRYLFVHLNLIVIETEQMFGHV